MSSAVAWVQIRAEDIEASLNAGELNEYRQHSAIQPDPLPTIVEDVVSLVRGYLSTRYHVTQPGIPASLKAAAVDLVIYRLCKRVQVGGEGSEQRKAAADDAVKLLERVSRGEFGDFGGVGGNDPKSGRWGSATRFEP